MPIDPPPLDASVTFYALAHLSQLQYKMFLFFLIQHTCYYFFTTLGFPHTIVDHFIGGCDLIMKAYNPCMHPYICIIPLYDVYFSCFLSLRH
jgi:hypothetical protein